MERYKYNIKSDSMIIAVPKGLGCSDPAHLFILLSVEDNKMVFLDYQGNKLSRPLRSLDDYTWYLEKGIKYHMTQDELKKVIGC